MSHTSTSFPFRDFLGPKWDLYYSVKGLKEYESGKERTGVLESRDWGHYFFLLWNSFPYFKRTEARDFSIPSMNIYSTPHLPHHDNYIVIASSVSPTRVRAQYGRGPCLSYSSLCPQYGDMHIGSQKIYLLRERERKQGREGGRGRRVSYLSRPLGAYLHKGS